MRAIAIYKQIFTCEIWPSETKGRYKEIITSNLKNWKSRKTRIKYTKRLGSFIKGLLPGYMTHTLLSKDKDEDTYRGTIEPLYNEVSCLSNSFLYPSNSKIYQ